MRVHVTFIHGSSIFGQIQTSWPSLGDVINDEHQFIKFIRPNGTECLLNKSSIAYIVEASDDL
jgi:hypothetical protein